MIGLLGTPVGLPWACAAVPEPPKRCRTAGLLASAMFYPAVSASTLVSVDGRAGEMSSVCLEWTEGVR